jgi:histidine ammonia-lyase
LQSLKKRAKPSFPESIMISIGRKPLSLNNLKSIVFEGESLSLDAAALRKATQSHKFLKDFSKGKLIYGINTGFGPMAQYKIHDRDLKQLQYNLIRSHCSGQGALLSPRESRALMVVRLNSLMQGYSGVAPDLLNLLKDLINKEIYPCVYEHGGVGASGRFSAAGSFGSRINR